MTNRVFLILLMLSFFSCFRKKSPPKTIEPWLEQQFSGQFEVLIPNLKMLDVLAQFRGEKRALVADKVDPDVQFLLDWEKGVESLGLDTQTVRLAHARAQEEVSAARAWYRRLKAAGLDNCSVGVLGQSLTVQVFDEPMAAQRTQALDNLRAALEKNPDQTPAAVLLEILEPAAYQTEYREVIPRGHWAAGTGWQRRNLILSLRLQPDSKPAPVWEINSESTRCSGYRQEASRLAKAWAEKNLPKPFFMEDTQPSGFEGLPPHDHSPAVRFAFPFFDHAPTDSIAEATGYVTVVFVLDEQVFSQIREQRKF